MSGAGGAEGEFRRASARASRSAREVGRAAGFAPQPRVRGFTIAEAAIVLLIVGLLIGGVIATFLQQQVAQESAETQRRLELAREAIIGFAIANGRLPCPAADPVVVPLSTGVESFVNTAGPPVDLACAFPFNGLVPALTLGLAPTDGRGFLVDAWGNPIRYAVTQWWFNATIAVPTPRNPPNCPPVAPAPAPVNPGPVDFTLCPAFTTAGAMKGLGFAGLPAPPAYLGLLQVCNAAACGPPAVGVQQTFLTPAVILSTGRNFNTQRTIFPPGTALDSPDEEENVHRGNPAAANAIFVSRPTVASPDLATNIQFDDQVIWISPNVLYNRLIAAGAL
jgi:type II secretory pathway pseudopilin PulG